MARLRSQILVGALAVALGGVARAQGTTSFTKGELQFTWGKRAYVLPLSKLVDASSLMGIGKDKFLLALVFTGEKKQGSMGAPNARMNLNVGGPGKYGKTAINNFVVQLDTYPESMRPWSFTAGKDDCAVELTRVDKSGVEGTISCTTAVPFSGMKFKATP